MGGFANAFKEVYPSVAKYFTESGEALLSHSPVGKQLSEFIKNGYYPAIDREAQKLISNGIDAVTAHSKATESIQNAAFGSKKQAIVPILQAARAQKGVVHANEVANYFDVLFKQDAPEYRRTFNKLSKKQGLDTISQGGFYVKQGAAEKAVKSIARPMFLPLISIPHATQAPLNSLLASGYVNTAKAFASLATSPKQARQLAIDAGLFSQEYLHEGLNAQKGKSSFSLLLDPLRNVFGAERKWGLALSAVSGKFSAISAAREFTSTQSLRAKMQLEKLGLDATAIRNRNGVLTAEEINQAAYRMGDIIMGFRSTLETPIGWEQNWATRLSSTYKHYGFRTAKLIKDSLVQAQKAGDYAGIASIATTLIGAFPVAGEIIKGLEGAATLQNPWSTEHNKDKLGNNEYFDAIAHAGGFGMSYAIVRAARYNHLLNWLAGPYFSSGADLAQDLWNRKFYNATRKTVRKAGLPGRIITNTVMTKHKRSN